MVVVLVLLYRKPRLTHDTQLSLRLESNARSIGEEIEALRLAVGETPGLPQIQVWKGILNEKGTLSLSETITKPSSIMSVQKSSYLLLFLSRLSQQHGIRY